jgi:hypothetical protein
MTKAQMMDETLTKGGFLDKLSHNSNIAKRVLKAHAQYRVKSGKFILVMRGGYVKLQSVQTNLAL